MKSMFRCMMFAVMIGLLIVSAALAQGFDPVTGTADLKALKLTDQGTCVLDGVTGTCPAIDLSRTYATAPKCFATWNGTGALTGILRATSTTTGLTVDSSVNGDTGEINWFCLGK